MISAYVNFESKKFSFGVPKDKMIEVLGERKIYKIDIFKMDNENMVEIINNILYRVYFAEGVCDHTGEKVDALILYGNSNDNMYYIEVDCIGNNYYESEHLRIEKDELDLWDMNNDISTDGSEYVITHDDYMIEIDNAININDEWYRENDDNIGRCDECGDYFLLSEGAHDENYTLCQVCYEDYYFTCENCDCIENRDNMYFCETHEMAFCESCYNYECNEQDFDGLNSYSYKPAPIFYGEGKYHFGIELECKFDDMQEAIDNLNEVDGIYLKEDSSISDGLEIVSHPMTIKYLYDNVIPEIVNCAKEYSGVSHNYGGMHVHIGRDRFTNNKQFSLFYDLINNNLEFTEFIAQRNISAWSRINPYSGDKNLSDCRNYNNIGRYSAVNINNLHTIEVRIFNGNLRKDRIMKNLEYIQALLDYSDMFTDSRLSTFLAYVQSNADLYPYLNNFIVEKDYI